MILLSNNIIRFTQVFFTGLEFKKRNYTSASLRYVAMQRQCFRNHKVDRYTSKFYDKDLVTKQFVLTFTC